MTTAKVTISSITKLSGWLWDDKVVGLGARRQAMASSTTFDIGTMAHSACTPLAATAALGRLTLQGSKPSGC
jgi:hypothetical protein